MQGMQIVKIKTQVLNLLSLTPVNTDEIIEFLQESPSIVLSALCELELEGLITKLKGGFYLRSI